jgi:Pectate lyase superfamily protein
MTAFISPPPRLQFFTNAGVPMASGLLYTYAAGTSTPLVTYTDSTGLVANTNPVILDSRGEASIWLGGVGYKFKLATPANIDIWTQDNIAPGSSAYMSYTPAGTGAVTTTVQTKLRESVSVKDFGAVGDGVTNDTAAIQAAITAAQGTGTSLFINPGSFIASALTISGNLRIYGKGTIKQLASTVAKLITISGTSTSATLDGITLDGNFQNQSATSANYSVFFSAVGTSSAPASLTVNNCTFVNGNATDITVRSNNSTATLEHLLVSNCRFLGGQEGQSAAHSCSCIDIESPIEYVITGNIFDYCGTPIARGKAGVVAFDSYALASPDKGRGAISNNVFNNVGRGGTDSIGAIDVYTYARSVAITGNVINNAYGRGIQVKADALNVTITGNVVDTLRGLNAVVPNAGIAVNSSTYTTINGNVTIVGNGVYDSTGSGIVVTGRDSGTTTFANNVVVSANVVELITLTGISVTDVTNVSVANNAVAQTTLQGIYVDNIRDSAVINGNSVYATANAGIYVGATTVVGYLGIVGNFISCTAYRCIDIRGASNGSVVGNVLNGAASTGLAIQGVTGKLRASDNSITASTAYYSNANSGTLRLENNSLSTAINAGTRNLTIAAGVVTAFLDYHNIDTEAAAATDDLDTINGGIDGAVITLSSVATARTVVCKDNTGNLKLAGDCSLNNFQNTITMRYMGGFWTELSRSTNG